MSNLPLWADSYAPGVPLHLEYGEETLVDQLERAALRHRDKPAIDFMGRVTKYHDLARDVSRVAQGLAELGVQRGDRVAILLPGCPQNVMATQAVMRLGAVAVQHNPLYTKRELADPFTDHQAKVVICWDKAAQMVLDIAQETPVEHIISVNITHEFPLTKRLALHLPLPSVRSTKARLTQSPPDGVLAWEDLLRHGDLPAWHERPTKDETAVMLYTSGTSGKPKGVPLSHANLVANAVQGKAWAQLRDGEETFLVVLPMFHAYGLSVSVLAGLNLGACLLISWPGGDTQDCTWLGSQAGTPEPLASATVPVGQ